MEYKLSKLFLLFAIVSIFSQVLAVDQVFNLERSHLYRIRYPSDILKREQLLKNLRDKLVTDHDYQMIDHELILLSNDLDVTTKFFELMKSENVSFTLLEENPLAKYKSSIEEFHRLQQEKPYSGATGLNMDRYYNHAEINAYLDELAKRYGSRVFVRTVGKSFEGRFLKTLIITNGDGRTNKNVVMVEAGIHGREWLSPATAVYIIKELVESFDRNAELLEKFDWIVLPVINPDGYEYSHLSDKIFWRLTRKPLFRNGRICYGADGNRNFDFHWGEGDALNQPCAESFPGLEPFSEPEVKVLRDLIRSYANKGSLYLSLHSFGSAFAYPWSWTRERAHNWELLHKVATAAAEAIQANSTNVYKVGSSASLFDVSGGGSDDFAYNEGYKFSYTIELSEGQSQSGFHPPATMIGELAREAWIGIRAMVQKIIEIESN